jgi:arsenate reductase
MLKVYGIANCDSCRKARKFLMEHDIDHEFHDVREEGLNIQMLERWASTGRARPGASCPNRPA